MNNEGYCERARLSAMAIADGEVGPLSVEQLDEHLKSCADCRRELEEQKAAIGLLGQLNRLPVAEDICSRVTATIEKSEIKPDGMAGLGLFIALGLILLVYRIIEVLPGFTLGLVAKLVPMVLVFVFFVLLKENPLKVNQNLGLKGDTTW